MVKYKSYLTLEGNEPNIPTVRNKRKYSNLNKYRGNKPLNKPIPKPETETNFQGRCTDLEGQLFDLRPISYGK